MLALRDVSVRYGDLPAVVEVDRPALVGAALRPATALGDLLVLVDGFSHFDGVAADQGGFTRIQDFDLLQHLTNDRFDVLIVDFHALQTIHFLNFRNQIFSQCFNAHDFKNVMRVR